MPKLSPSEVEIVWAAGFWEGEGSISTRSVTASQVDKWPLERLMNSFGGTISLRKSQRPNQRECWQWFLCGENARLFVELISPYLSPRRLRQISEIFITNEKRKRMRKSIKERARITQAFRVRDELGRYSHATLP